MSLPTIDAPRTIDHPRATEEVRRPQPGAVLRRLLGRIGDYGIIVSFVVLFVALSLGNDAFLTKTNLLNVLDQQASLGIVACGITLAMIAGEFDLSVGAVFAISGVLAAKVGSEVDPGLGLLTAVGVGTAFGIANGLLVTVGRIKSFIATLASSIIISGLAIAITGGFLVSVKEASFRVVGREELFGVRYSIWIFALFAAVTWFLLSRTILGRYIYAGNREAARLSGIRVDLIRFLTMVIAGFSAGLGAMLMVSRVGTAQAGVGAGLELTAIAAVVIGGTSIAGGDGAIWRSVLGVLLLAMIRNGFNLMGIEPTYQRIFEGGLIVIAVAIDAWARKRRAYT